MVETRIIPALAGNTAVKTVQVQFGKDHPRSRGEYYIFLFLSFGVSGSSPLSRGIRAAATSVRPQSRIIPALAGNTVGC